MFKIQDKISNWFRFIKSINAPRFHYIINPSNSTSIDLQKQLFTPVGERFSPIVVDQNLYFLNDPRNQNHFSLSHYWNTIIPQITHDIGLNIDQTKFELIHQTDDEYGYDLSYHELADDKTQFEQLSLIANRHLSGDHLTVFRKDPLSTASMYHKLCIDAHMSQIISKRSGQIFNRRLIIICDSIAVPIIPILAYFFDSILVIDVVHSHKLICDLTSTMYQFRPTELITIHSSAHFDTPFMFDFGRI